MTPARVLTRFTSRPIEAIKDRPWKNPALEATLEALPRMSTAAEAVDAALAYLRPLRARVEEHVQASQELGDALVPGLTHLRERHRITGSQDAERADLLALLGRALIARAWQVRGSDAAATVFPDAWGTFRSLLEEADDALSAALGIDAEHAAAATFRLTTALGLGATSKEWWARFETARMERSTLFPAHWSMLNGLCAKWYGSDEAMFDFGRQIAANAPVADPVVAMLPLAHAEYVCSLIMKAPGPTGTARQLLLRRRRADLDAVVAASYRWCGDGSGQIPVHPCDVQAHNLFGWFLGISGEHRERGRWHLQQAEGRMTGPPWNYLRPDPIRSFQRLHARLGIA